MEEDEDVVSSPLADYLTNDLDFGKEDFLIVDSKGNGSPVKLDNGTKDDTQVECPVYTPLSFSYSFSHCVCYLFYHLLLMGLKKRNILETVMLDDDFCKLSTVWSKMTFQCYNKYHLLGMLILASLVFGSVFLFTSLLVVSTCLATIVTVQLVSHWKYIYSLFSTLYIVVYCYKMRQLTSDILQYIQEVELVSRGFTFVSAPGIAYNLHRLESDSDTRQCYRLRRQLFHSTRHLLHNIRQNSRTLIDYSKNSSLRQCLVDLDVLSSSCLALTSDSEFGDAFQDNTDYIATLTDHYSLLSLKSMVHLYNLHVSEFATLLLVSLEPYFYSFQQSSLRSLESTFEEHFLNVSICYDLHLASITTKPANELDKEIKVLGNKNGEKSIIWRSLQLHLERALTIVRSSSVNKLNDNDMSSLRANCDAIVTCLDDLERSDRPFQSSTDSLEAVDVSKQSSKVVSDTSTVDEHTVVESEDQFLECFVTGSDDTDQGSTHNMQQEFDEDSARRVFRESVGKPVMSELRSVIRNKRIEFAEREMVARAKTGCQTTTCDDDEDDELTGSRAGQSKYCHSSQPSSHSDTGQDLAQIMTSAAIVQTASNHGQFLPITEDTFGDSSEDED